MAQYIRVVRNDAGNCINFYGTSNPSYWNACLSASIDQEFPDRINVRNDIRSAEESSDVFEFYQIPYTTFLDKDGNAFESPAEAAQYITDNAHVIGGTGTYIFSETETLDAHREDTNTTVLFSNGDIFAVNSLRAYDAPNGTITIETIRANKEVYKNIRFYNVTVNSGAVSFNTLSAAVDRLNEVLSGGAVTSDGGTVPGQANTLPTAGTFEVYGPRITETGSGATAGYTSTRDEGNFDTSNGILSVQHITEAGEFFEFDQAGGDWSNTNGLTFGLFDETTYDRSDLEVDEPGNAVKAILRLRIKNSPFLFKDPASTLGRLDEAGINNSIDTRQNFRVGLDGLRRGYISVRLDDGSYQLVGRTESAIPEGTELKLVVIFPLANEMNGIRNMTVNYLTSGPTLTWHYIESPDGSFYYPLFSDADQAAYVDEEYGTAASGAGQAHVHIFPDEVPTANYWYMPTSYAFHNQSSAPAALPNVVWNEILTDTDANYAPADLTLSDQNWDENVSVNLQIVPAGSDPATVTGLPTGLSYSNGFIQGTTPYVSANTNYTVTVLRSNSYGSNSQTFTITITDNAALGAISGWTVHQGNTVSPSTIKATENSVLEYNTLLTPGKRVRIPFSGIMKFGIPNASGIANRETVDIFDKLQDNTEFDLLLTIWEQGDINPVNGVPVTGAGIGWLDNSPITQPGHTNNDVYFLEYRDDNKFYLLNNDSGELLLESAATYGAAVPLYYGTPEGYTQDKTMPSVTLEDIEYQGDAIEGFTMDINSEPLIDASTMGDGAVVKLDEEVINHHRLVIRKEWVEQNVMPGLLAETGTSQFFIGIPKSNADWTSLSAGNGNVAAEDFQLAVGFAMTDAIRGASWKLKLYKNGAQVHDIGVGGTGTNVIYDFVFSNVDGRWEMCIQNNYGSPLPEDAATEHRQIDGGSWSQCVVDTSFSTGAESIYFGAQNTQATLDLTGVDIVREPFLANDILVGESSDGKSRFESATIAYYDGHSNGHSGFSNNSWQAPTLNAGTTYRFIYHASMEANDAIKFTRADDGTDYTTGVTFFGDINADPTFTSNYKGVEFAVPTDVPPLNIAFKNGHNGNQVYGNVKELPISGSTYTVNITNVTQEGPATQQDGDDDNTNLFDQGVWGWISIDEQLGAGERLVMDGAFLYDLVDAMPDRSIVYIGLKDNARWTNALSTNGFMGMSANGGYGGLFMTILRDDVSDVTVQVIGADSSSSSVNTTVANMAQFGAFIDITNSGNNIRIGYTYAGDNSNNDESTTPYADWGTTRKLQTGDRGYGLTNVDVMILGGGHLSGNAAGMDAADVDWTGLSEIAVPTTPAPITTSWNKAIDFSGSSERTQQVENNSNRCPIMMGGASSQVSMPVPDTNTVNSGHPWATSCVFKIDGNSSNQHIWNLGEGSGANDDNIYLRVDASQRLYFGWGRAGELNECYIHTLSSAWWYGIYVGFNGARYGGPGSTASRLNQIFDIKLMSSIDSFGSLSELTSLQSGWTHGASSTGGRMDRQFSGLMTIGGRGSNRNFHGKVASMAVTTLRCGQPMPSDNEISMMIRDPMQWLNDYKVGNAFRLPWQTSDSGWNFSMPDGSASYATQVWLMGDGSTDAYPQIRNQVVPNSQSYTPMNMTSMVANDIETVNIPGLT